MQTQAAVQIEHGWWSRMIPSAPQQQPPQNRHRSLSLSSGGVISARTEEIQSALEVQVRRLFERFGGGALWGRRNRESAGREAPPAAESPGSDGLGIPGIVPNRVGL